MPDFEHRMKVCRLPAGGAGGRARRRPAVAALTARQWPCFDRGIQEPPAWDRCEDDLEGMHWHYHHLPLRIQVLADSDQEAGRQSSSLYNHKIGQNLETMLFSTVCSVEVFFQTSVSREIRCSLASALKNQFPESRFELKRR